jgi:hypothetical protein
MKTDLPIRFLALIGLLSAGVAVGTPRMHVAGDISVNARGVAEFAIPIQMPPQPGKTAPRIELTYKSDGSNGLFGVGWALTGLPSITRCTKTVGEEGVRVGVQNNQTDLFCLNGEKLRLTSGTYGGDGAQYRTAIDSFSRVTSFGVSGSGPRWFRVERKNGEILELGNSEDSRLELPASSTVRVWMISSSRDRSSAGNVVRYVYEKNLTLGEQVLSTVLLPMGALSIEYEARPVDDVLLAYANGVQFSSTNRRAKTIRIYDTRLVNGAGVSRLFKEYRLGYTQSGATRRSLLNTVTECALSDATPLCLPPLTVSYSNSSANDVTLVPTPFAGGRGYTTAIDIQGLGRETLLKLVVGEASPSGVNGSTYVGGAVWDHNSDGLQDLVYMESTRSSGQRSLVSYSNGTALASGTLINDWYWCHADFDGDGRTEAIASTLTGSVNSPKLNVGQWTGATLTNFAVNTDPAIRDLLISVVSSRSPCIAVDLDGDGRSELLVRDTPTSISAFQITGSGSQTQIARVMGSYIGQSDFQVGDFNGDGRTDYMLKPVTTTPYLFLSHSAGGFVSVAAPPHSGVKTDYSCTGDFNGDGRTDTFDWQSGDFLLSVGNAFLRTSSGMAPIVGTLGTVCGDFNGDGKADIYVPQTGYIWSSRSTGPTDMVARVDYGNGKAIRLEYKPLSDSSVYTRGAAVTFPIQNVQNGMPVVSKLQESDGRGGFRDTVYAYSGLRRNLQKGQLLGFESMTETDAGTGISTRTTFRQDYPFIGLVSQRSRFDSQRTLHSSSYSYLSFDVTSQYARVCSSITAFQEWDLNGAFKKWTRQTDSNPDSYCNHQSVLLENLATDGSVVSSSAIQASFLNDVSRWLIGIPTSIRSTRQVPSAPIGAALGTP